MRLLQGALAEREGGPGVGVFARHLEQPAVFQAQGRQPPLGDQAAEVAAYWRAIIDG